MSEPDGFLVVVDWADLQHYKDRSPPWIKLHSAMLESYEFSQLTDAQKGQLLCIHMLASRMSNRIPNDASWIASKIGASEPIDTSVFVLAGFLEVVEQRASKTLAKRKQKACLEERRGETEGERVVASNGNHAPRWETPFYDEHLKSIGVIDYGALSRQLKPLRAVVKDDAKMLAGFKLWAANPKDSGFGIPWFVKNFNRFDVGPLTDEHGSLNPLALARMGIQA